MDFACRFCGDNGSRSVAAATEDGRTLGISVGHGLVYDQSTNLTVLSRSFNAELAHDFTKPISPAKP
jgi:hypothetical protein